MNKLSAGLAGLLSCCNMLQIISPLMMAAVGPGPLLTCFLDHCFHAGALTPCISLEHVRAIHTKDCTLDAAVYWPIAVAEPLYRVYTPIFDRRLAG